MKKTVHLSRKTETFIDERTGQEAANYSAHLNSAIDQLSHIMREQYPNLTEDELGEIVKIYEGKELIKLPLPCNIARDMLEHYGATVPMELPENCQELVNKLAMLSQAEQLAVIDVVRLQIFAKQVQEKE